MDEYELVIIGAGPVGLAAAIEAKRIGINYIVLEKGVLANSIYNFPTQMRFFTTADLLEIGNHPFPSTDTKPTRQMALDYYRRTAQVEELNIQLFHDVTTIDVKMGIYTISGYNRRFDEPEKFTLTTKFIVVATGYYDNPRGLGGIQGEDSSHVKYYYDDPHKYYGMNVVIVGAGNSGAEAALDLYRHGANVTLIHRHPEPSPMLKYWVAPDLKNRIKENSIKAIMPGEIVRITRKKVYYKSGEETSAIDTDVVFALTGFRPNTKLFEIWGVTPNEDGSLELKPTFESTRSNMYFVGSCGQGNKLNSVFIENGREHAKIALKNIKMKLNY